MVIATAIVLAGGTALARAVTCPNRYGGSSAGAGKADRVTGAEDACHGIATPPHHIRLIVREDARLHEIVQAPYFELVAGLRARVLRASRLVSLRTRRADREPGGERS